jgi:hypothetical protein
MNRCRPATPFLAALCLLATALSAQAQDTTLPAQPNALDRGQLPIIGARQFPANAKRGTLEVKAPPEVLINGTPERLSPGSRIRSPQNHLVMSGQLVGSAVQVNYLRDNLGQISEVWILNALEAREERQGGGPVTNYRFGSQEDAARSSASQSGSGQGSGFRN